MERVVVEGGSIIGSGRREWIAVPAAFLLKQKATFFFFFPTGQSAGYLRRARSELHLRAAGPAKVF